MYEEEFNVSDCMGDEASLFDMAMADVKDIPVLSKEEEAELGRRILEGDIEARNELVVHNLRWAAKQAIKASKKSNFSPNDIYGVYSLALLRAADKFDYRSGVKFVTFATYEMDAAFGKFARKFSCPVSISEHDNEVLSALKLIQYNCHPKELSNEELAQAYNETHKRQIDASLVGALLGTLKSASLYKTVGVDSDSGSKLTVMDKIPSNTSSTSGFAERKVEREVYLQAINSLDPRRAEIVRLVCGFEGEPLNFREVGERMELSSERTRQLFKSACTDLKNGPYAPKLSMFYDNAAGEKVS